MPKITINEVDLTKASLQPSPTDIAFVPGLSCLDNATSDLTYCESIVDFEEKFGTYPAIMDIYRVYNDSNGTVLKEKYVVVDKENFEKNFYQQIYKNSTYKKVSKYGGTLSGVTQLVLGFDTDNITEANITTYLTACGIVSAESSFDSTGLKTIYLDFDYDMSYVYAKELIMMGIPVVYKVLDTPINNPIEEEFTGADSTVTATNYPVVNNSASIVSITTSGGTNVAVADDASVTVGSDGKTLTILNGTGTAITSTDKVVVKYNYIREVTYSNILSTIKTYFANSIPESNVMQEGILDKGEYSIKYITSGSYPAFGYKEVKSGNDTSYSAATINYFGNMAKIASGRGDCVALIDPADCTTTDSDRNITIEQMINPDNIFAAAEAICGDFDSAEYASLFAPWILYNSQASYSINSGNSVVILPQLDSIIMPPSFAYLVTLAKSIRINNNWLAVAGIARGQVPYIDGLYTTKRLSNSLANYYQPRNGKTSINAITDIKPYGLTIWGNRTMKNNLVNAMGGEDGLTATSFLNIRNMVSDVKKTAYVAAKTLMFEQNSDVLWVNFLSRVTPLLDQLMSGQGLSDYKVIKNPTNEKAKLKATIKLYPIYAVEDFDITIELSDEDVSVV